MIGFWFCKLEKMSIPKYEYSKVYEQDFFPRKYLTELYSTLYGAAESGELFLFSLKTIIELSKSLPDKIERALDFGCGPVVQGLMSVAERIQSEVIYSDYARGNLDEIEKWMAKTDDFFSFLHFSTVHAEATRSTPEKLEAALRSKFKGTMSSDIFVDDIMPLNKGKKFDYIFTSMCIEGCCTTQADYDNGIAKLAELLTPGGFVIQYCVLNQDDYQLGDVTIPSLNLSFEDAKDAWAKAGCAIVETRHLPNIAPGVEVGVCTFRVRK